MVCVQCALSPIAVCDRRVQEMKFFIPAFVPVSRGCFACQATTTVECMVVLGPLRVE